MTNPGDEIQVRYDAHSAHLGWEGIGRGEKNR